MSDKRFSARGKLRAAGQPMSLAFDQMMFSEIRSRDGIDQDRKALDEARHWLGRLTAAEYRGPGDTIGAARTRLAREVGIRPSYAARMWNRAAEMTGVAGGAYRALKLAYEDQCRRIEERGDHYRSLREELGHEDRKERRTDALALADVEAPHPHAPTRPPTGSATG